MPISIADGLRAGVSGGRNTQKRCSADDGVVGVAPRRSSPASGAALARRGGWAVQEVSV
jgi:hypothetical protein